MATQAITRRPRFILVSDLDWTMVDHNDLEHKQLKAFNSLWSSHFAKDSLLVFSTGRSHSLFIELRDHVPLGEPDVLGWNRQQILQSVSEHHGLKLQAESEQRPHKISYHVSLTASKGKGLEFLLEEIEELVGLPPDGVMVCGDSGNDIELFAVPDARGCMVANAHPELKQWCDAHASSNLFQASERCAGGIIQALQHFKLA
ncbi:hypothetical protein WJX73_004740 [Symbiochloris irregularis]|uniref:Sucrose phosphatase-like domain-containing protein n=1 Tax=Symbiochloris irregularis TaxID=706552 RepID=A0AAW1NW61_9CHLO